MKAADIMTASRRAPQARAAAEVSLSTLPLPIDIPRVLEDIAYMLGEPEPTNKLLRAPLRTEKLAEALGVPRSTLRGWIDGSDPGLHHGLMIIGLWCQVTGKAQTFIHRQQRPLSASQVR